MVAVTAHFACIYCSQFLSSCKIERTLGQNFATYGNFSRKFSCNKKLEQLRFYFWRDSSFFVFRGLKINFLTFHDLKRSKITILSASLSARDVIGYAVNVRRSVTCQKYNGICNFGEFSAATEWRGLRA